jgi:NADH-quinone oxidoreductase subunit M
MMNSLDRNLLSALIFVPLVGALAIALVPRRLERVQRLAGLAISGLVFLLALRAVALFQVRPGMQLEIQRPWLPSYGISYHLGLDGLSLWLVVLTALLTPLALLGSWRGIATRVREFQIFVLLSEAGMLGVFCALDLVLFYVFWEAMLIPMYFLIGIWGYERRIYAAVKFFLFTMAGSVLMLVAFLVLYQASGLKTFDMLRLVGAPLA